jgi:prepilin-type N-terminal cleavage/methylation domain-containing protein
MKNIKNNAFTLVELLVVITILAIISVVAYQNFWWAVDKAVSWRKISDVSTIETSLQQYKADKNYYPPADVYSATNLWGHNTLTDANPSNTIKVLYSGQEITSIDTASTKGWWKVMANAVTPLIQIWSKWTISRETVWKKYLSKDLYDPELWDITVNDIDWAGTKWKMIDKWIGRYVYAIYKKWTNNVSWNDYNIAYTIKKQESDKYITKIVWSYDAESCYWDPTDCPETLIGQYNEYLQDWDEQQLNAGVIDTSMSNQWIPYAVTDFTAQ